MHVVLIISMRSGDYLSFPLILFSARIIGMNEVGSLLSSLVFLVAMHLALVLALVREKEGRAKSINERRRQGNTSWSLVTKLGFSTSYVAARANNNGITQRRRY